MKVIQGLEDNVQLYVTATFGPILHSSSLIGLAQLYAYDLSPYMTIDLNQSKTGEK